MPFPAITKSSAPPGFWAITGGKLTTYRAMAERIVDKIVRDEFGDRRLGPCSTVGPIVGADRPMPGGASPPLQELWSRYGSEALAIDALIRESPELAEPIDDRAPYCWAEVVYSLRKRIRRANRRPHRPAAGAFLSAPGLDLRDKIEALDRAAPILGPGQSLPCDVAPMKRFFVINPNAGAGMSPRAIERLEHYFRHRANSFDAVVSQSRDDVIHRTRQRFDKAWSKSLPSAAMARLTR